MALLNCRDECLPKERCKIIIKNVQFVPLFEKFSCLLRATEQAHCDSSKDYTFYGNLKPNSMGTMGAKRDAWIASTTFSRARFETRTRFMWA